jgi:GntR family transcriptional regulator/MocR family aminotransferase
MGYLPLRATIAGYVGSTRGVRCTADQVMIVSGTQHGVDLALRAVTDSGDKVWMEDPGYFGFRGAIVANGCHPVAVGVDHEGLDVEEGRRLAPSARMAFVTPMHQVPLCVPMSDRRRAALLAWAEEEGAWIFEDDYNSDFHYSTRPGVALRAMNGGNHVIYCGTFSKSLFPGLRIGFIVVPESLVREFRAVRFFSDLQPSYLDQATLAEFIAEGHYERHIRRLRSIYQSRRDCLLDGLAQCAAWLTPTRYDSGREITVWLDQRLNDVVVAEVAERAGVTVMPLSPWATVHALAPSLRLGYSGIDEKDIQTGVTRLARVLESLHPAPHRAVPLPGVSKNNVAVVAAVQDRDATPRIEGHRGSAAARWHRTVDASPDLVDERPG